MISRIRAKQKDTLPALFQSLVHVADERPYAVGTVIGSNQKFELTDAQVSVHMAILGGSGSGKTKLLELLLRQRLLDGKAFGLWDPHGDLTKSLAAFVAAHTANGNDELWRKVHYLDLTPECIFAFDPVARAPRRSDVGDYAYYQWLRVHVERVWKVIMRRVSEVDQDVMVRLKRWMRCVLYACLVAIDDKNTHMGLDKALIFTDPQCDEFRKFYPKVAPHLPPRVRRNFEKLIETKRPQDQEKWVESTINKLEEALSPLTEAVYSQERPSIDIKGIIDRGEFLLIDLKENEYFSSDEKVVLGGLLLSEVLSVKRAEENKSEDERKEFMIVVDEVGELLGDDLSRALGATRKFKCPIVLGAQDLSTFARGDFDMAAKVLSMCGTVVCFQNTYKPDKELLADRVFCGNKDLFTKRMIEVQRQRGDRVLRYDEISENFGMTKNWSNTRSLMESEMHAHMVGEALMRGENFSDGTSLSEGLTRKKHGGSIAGDVENKSTSRNAMKGGSKATTRNDATTDSATKAVTDAAMQGGAQNYGVTVNHKIVVQPNIVSEFDEDATLEHGANELQEAQNEQKIHKLGVGQAAVAIRGIPKAVVVQVMTVEEWFTDGSKKHEAFLRLQNRLHAFHPYYFKPSRHSTVGALESTKDPLNGHTTNGRHSKKAVETPEKISMPD